VIHPLLWRGKGEATDKKINIPDKMLVGTAIDKLKAYQYGAA